MASSHQPIVSVIIPCYNQATYLPAAIESVIVQTYKSFEIIVVNDGSKDNTDEVAQRYEAVIYLEQVNQGVSTARNNGLKIAKGKYIIFLDSDDVLLPSALELGVQILEGQPQTSFVSSRCELRTRSGKLLICSPEVSNPSYEELLRRNFIWHPASVMFRKDILCEIGGFDRQYNICADFDLYIRIARQHDIACASNINSVYYQTKDSLSSNSIMLIKERIPIYQREAKYLQGDPALLHAYQEGYRYYLNTYGSDAVSKFLYQLRKFHLNGELLKNIFYILAFRHPFWLIRQIINKTLQDHNGALGKPSSS